MFYAICALAFIQQHPESLGLWIRERTLLQKNKIKKKNTKKWWILCTFFLLPLAHAQYIASTPCPDIKLQSPLYIIIITSCQRIIIITLVIKNTTRFSFYFLAWDMMLIVEQPRTRQVSCIKKKKTKLCCNNRMYYLL